MARGHTGTVCRRDGVVAAIGLQRRVQAEVQLSRQGHAAVQRVLARDAADRSASPGGRRLVSAVSVLPEASVVDWGASVGLCAANRHWRGAAAGGARHAAHRACARSSDRVQIQRWGLLGTVAGMISVRIVHRADGAVAQWRIGRRVHGLLGIVQHALGKQPSVVAVVAGVAHVAAVAALAHMVASLERGSCGH